jgi:PqqD family protein of HPr-rel-A system
MQFAVKSIQWRQFDDEWVVFQPDNGVLTALDAFNATVLDSLERGALTAETVAAMLARDADLPLTTTLTDKIAQVLATLVTAGLVQTVQP